ncbi:hypothetical protein H696_01268 [Fonticula alba]|uniref:FACT complex subunit n=1 Tax=Fonticula alba TaxID=691883 RepID=A0A058ZBT1_FONAL|nr:hypothetical protein H696_01268 [Fonticula alba]KCV71854.1 hypothetical protein H696_01268 [Fonticula alba]|eukprot:XP_009493432.1 hypothetical protein H696_01268 [Fonticula alba]
MSRSSSRIDEVAFLDRITKLADTWRSHPELFNHASQLVVIVGKNDSNNDNDLDGFETGLGGDSGEKMQLTQRASAMHHWLFGYEVLNTLLIFSLTNEEESHTSVGLNLEIVCSNRLAAFFNGIPPDVASRCNLVVRGFDTTQSPLDQLSEAASALFERVSTVAEIAVLPSGRSESNFSAAWKEALTTAGNARNLKFSLNTAPTFADGLAEAMIPKDNTEMDNIRSAATVAGASMRAVVFRRLYSYADRGRAVTHEAFGASLDQFLEEPTENLLEELRVESTIDADFLELGHMTTVLSGPSTARQSTLVKGWPGPPGLEPTQRLRDTAGSCVSVALTMRYRNYCAPVARTFLFSPSQDQSDDYEALLALRRHLLVNLLTPGAKLAHIYRAAKNFVEARRPGRSQYLSPVLGFMTGLRFRESEFTISESTPDHVTLQASANLCLSLSFVDVPFASADSRCYSLYLVDTVAIFRKPVQPASPLAAAILAPLHSDGPDAAAPMALHAHVLTFRAPWRLRDIILHVVDEQGGSGAGAGSKPESEDEGPRTRAGAAGRRSILMEDRLRSSEGMSREEQRQLVQKELFNRMQEQGKIRQEAAHSKDGYSEGGNSATELRKYEAYRDESQIPPDRQYRRIFIDRRADAVVLPIFGLAVPFHLSTIRSTTLSAAAESGFLQLRINFATPGQTVSKREVMTYMPPNQTYIRELTFRAPEPADNLRHISDDIKNARRAFVEREIEKRDREHLIDQEQLKLIDGRVPVLDGIRIRPSLGPVRGGGGDAGSLQIHANGIRFRSRAQGHVDITFANIKHMIFQPSEGEQVVILHFHLRHAIIIGRKKTVDVQFYYEVVTVNYDDVTSASSSRRLGAGASAQSEAELERMERRQRLIKDREFDKFADRISRQSNGAVKVDTPIRNLAFSGVPFRANVLMQPTSYTLMHITEAPYFIVTLEEVELVYFERITFGLRNFDMVFIFKDYARPPVRVSVIPVQQLEDIRNWLTTCEIPFLDGRVNLNWNQVMRNVREPYFFQDGGWSILVEGSDSEEEEVDSGPEFIPSDASSSESDYSSEDDASEESDFSEEEDSGSESEYDDSEEESESDDDYWQLPCSSRRNREPVVFFTTTADSGCVGFHFGPSPSAAGRASTCADLGA